MREQRGTEVEVTGSLNEVHHVELRGDQRYEGRYHLSCSTCGPLAWSARARSVWVLAEEHRDHYQAKVA
ncbi:MAG: hypothetical protein ACYCUF_04585 [Acidimicrobiales bacterium]|jgi:hypothetical protein|nr:hypothetical protein [Actinomycetota bacterium]